MWGLFHGFFLALERTWGGRKLLGFLPGYICYIYTMLIVIVGWVFFRADSFSYALEYLKAMVDFTREPFFNSQLFLNMNNEFYVVFFVALLGASPFYPVLTKFIEKQTQKYATVRFNVLGSLASLVSLTFFSFVFLYSLSSISGGLYNPFLYFRF